MRALLNRKCRVAVLTAGAGLFALQGCDPAVRETVLTGVGDAATGLAGTFIQAVIESLLAKDAEDQAATVRAADLVPQIFT